jgi:hypothetical protein
MHFGQRHHCCKLRYVAAVLSVTATLLWSPQTLQACKCASGKVESAATWIRGFDGIVFRGTVSNVVVLNVPVDPVRHPGDFYREKEVTFVVEEIWKGPERKELTIRTGMGDGDCGLSFYRGESYFVAAEIIEGKIYTGICSTTQLDKKTVPALGKGKPPR